MARGLASAAFVAALFSAVYASDIPKCGPGLKCPESTPCCSMYGQCGVGAYCLGGCDPLFSNKLESCVPNPICKSQDYKFNSNLDSLAPIDKYLGDSSKAAWVSSGKPLSYNGDGVLLTMAQDTVGTLLATTHYVWYGKITAKMTSSQGKGVVTAFIMMSDVKDEIDFEWVGTDVQNVQSNFYSQGVTNYNNGRNHSASDTQQKLHTYTIDWKPDTLTWSVDGNVVRTLKKEETWNATSNRFDYPQTPSKVMLSLWPAGLPSNGEGTVNWAGGLIDWNSAYMQNGYYYALVKEVSVECYDPPTGAQIKSSNQNSYIYTDQRGTNDTIAITDKLTVLSSFYATGEDSKKDPNASKSSSAANPSKTESSSKPEPTPETVPGMSGGNRETNNQNTGSDNSDNGNQAATTGSNTGATPTNPSTSSNGGFNQGGNPNAAALGKEKRIGESVFAAFIALVALLSF